MTIDNATRQLLAHLHRGGGWSYWYTLPAKRSTWWPVEEPSPIPQGRQSVYFGVHPAPALPQSPQGGQGARIESMRARIDDVPAVNCVFCDFDAEDFVPIDADDAELEPITKQVLAAKPDTKADQAQRQAIAKLRAKRCLADLPGFNAKALAHIEQLPCAPSVIIGTGGGYHAYWLLREPYIIASSQERDRVRQLQAAWVGFAHGDPGAKDLARMLRVPGTRNYKPEYAPNFPVVAFVRTDFDRLYHPEELARQTLTKYAAAALRDEIAALGQAIPGQRNDHLNRSGYKLGQLVASGLLQQSRVEDELYRTACQIGLDQDPGCGEQGIRATIHSGLEAGMEAPRPLWDLVGKFGESRDSFRTEPGYPTDHATATQESIQPVQEGSLADIMTQLEKLRTDDKLPDRDTVQAKALDLVEACSHLRKDGLLRISARLQDLRLPRTWIKQWESAVSEKARAQTRAFAGPSLDLSDALPYEVGGGRIYFLTRRPGENGMQISRTVVADFEAHIAEEAVTESGQRWYQIAGRTFEDQPFDCEISAEAFADDRGLQAVLTAAAGARAPVRAGMTKHLRPAIQLLTNGDLRKVHRYERTGWIDQARFLIPGHEPGEAIIRLPVKLPYAIDAQAKLNQGLEALHALINAMPLERSTVAATVIFQAPLAQLAGWRNERYALFIAGRTGSLKSSWAQTGMAIYGRGFTSDAALIKWGEGATRNAIMALATHAHDLPILIDNYKPNTGGGSRDFVNLIHNLVEGGEKERLTRAAELRDSKPVYAWPIFTGEDAPGDDAASLARVLVVPFAWERGKANDQLTQAQRLAQHLPAIGGAWLSWLVSPDGRAVAEQAGAQFPKLRTEWAAWVSAKRKDVANVLRVATNLATNQLTWWALQQHPILGSVASRYADAHQAGLEAIGAEMADHTAESLEATRFLSVLRELLASQRLIMVERQSRPGSEILHEQHLGWRDAQGVYVLPSIARQAVERVLGQNGLGGLSDQALYAQLDELGMLASKDPGRRTKTVRVGPSPGEPQRVLHLKSDALMAAGA